MNRCYVTGFLSVRIPVPSGMRAWLYRHSAREVYPWNVTFARTLPAGSPYAARPVIAGKDAWTQAGELLAVDEATYRDAFRGSAMKRAKPAGLPRNARVVSPGWHDR